MSETCWRCGVRANVGCKHRPASGEPAPVEPVTKSKAFEIYELRREMEQVQRKLDRMAGRAA